jgi:ribosomal protein L37AE/L43A
MKYQETNGIPVCPFCQKPTERTGGMGTVTLAYFTPVYDETGKNINPDRNTCTTNWHCNNCGKDYQTEGNDVDGFHYKGVKE